MAEDKGGWWGEPIYRRDQRQTKVPDIRPPSGSRKDTKKWCRGKVGRTHKPVCMPYNEVKNQRPCHSDSWKVLVCSECEKILDHWHPSPFRRVKQDPPAWASQSVDVGQ